MQVQDSVTHGIAGSAIPILPWSSRSCSSSSSGPTARSPNRRSIGSSIQLDPTGMATDRIDAAASSFDAIYAAVTAAPFFGSQRVIVLSGLLTQSASKGGRGTKARSETDLSKIAAAIPETNTLILVRSRSGRAQCHAQESSFPTASLFRSMRHRAARPLSTWPNGLRKATNRLWIPQRLA